jgi:PhnB protein
MKITSYLVFNGEAEEAARFYADALNGSIENLYRYSDMPPVAGMPPVPDNMRERVMHCCISFDGGSMSVADTLPTDPRDFGNGGHILTLSCDSVHRAEEAYAKLTQGARKIVCPLGEAFFAKRYAEVVDRWGVMWAVMYEEN